MAKGRIFQYPHCSTCTKALNWLSAQGVEFQSIDITLHPLSILSAALGTDSSPAIADISR